MTDVAEPKNYDHYSRVAVALHWLIAAAIVFMIPLGFWMHEALDRPGSQAAAKQAFALHKSIGLTILALSLVRLAWRLAHRAPPLPAGMPRWERYIARASHFAFYVVMILAPLSGWAYVSAGYSFALQRTIEIPTVWFGLFVVPPLPFVHGLPEEARMAAAAISGSVHYFVALFTAGLIALHVAAALKHDIVNHDDVLSHMAPAMAPRDIGGKQGFFRWALLIASGLAAAVVVIFAAKEVFEPEDHEPPASQAAVVGTPTTDTASAAPEAGSSVVVPGAPAGLPPTARAVRWKPDYKASTIGFSGSNAGTPFSGRFERWSADIAFDPKDLSHSAADISFDIASAVTDDVESTEAITKPDWLDAQAFPRARFLSQAIRSISPGQYQAVGTLNLHGKNLVVVLPFSLTMNGDEAQMEGRLTLDRLAFGIGAKADPNAQWVSRQIVVTISMKATRAP